MSNIRITITDTYPELTDIGVRSFGYYSNKTVQNKLLRCHHGSCFGFHYIETGAQPYYTYPSGDAPEEAGTLYWMYGGDIFITRPYEYHSTGLQPQQRGKVYWIHVDSACPALLKQSPECVERLQRAMDSLNRHVLRIPASIASRLIEAFHLLLDMDEDRLLRACSLLTLFIFELADYNARYAAESDRRGKLSKKGSEAVAFIMNNLLSPTLNLEEIAKQLNYSSAYTSTFFKKEVGITVHEFIMRNKINYACTLLERQSVTNVANLLNFSSSQHFSKVFKEQKGMTPSEYIRVNKT